MIAHKRILITGAAGIVGTGMRPHLARAFPEIVLVDHKPAAGLAPNEKLIVGDIADPALVSEAMAGVTGVVHLACAYGPGIGFEQMLDTNYRAFILLLDALVREGGQSFVFTSSNHGWGYYPRGSIIGVDKPPRPDSWYGIAKIFGEALLAHYADTHSFSGVSLRIGNAHAEVGDERRTHMWISHRDLAELTRLALVSGAPGHRAVFATADCADPFFDNSGLAALGFVTRDRPEDNLADPAIAGEPRAPGIGGEAVGGGYVEESFRGSIEAWRKSNIQAG